MSFRVRRGFLSGSPILQVSTLGKWRDAEVLPDLEAGFHIVSDAWMAQNDDILRDQGTTIAILKARVKLYEHRAAIARKSRAKKRAPTLTDALPGSDLDRLEQRVDAQGMGYVVKRNDDGSFSDAVTGRAIEFTPTTQHSIYIARHIPTTAKETT